MYCSFFVQSFLIPPFENLVLFLPHLYPRLINVAHLYPKIIQCNVTNICINYTFENTLPM